ncbi:primosomal protein N' [Streptacidiphilus jiangxiensis]|uniref:Probable replication restart protein PriA n=1 Tax=Streptacidiphilus jiangxiensis TaxID=235985 RepID=A0A1H7YH30_STRJI|nr:primosomal protein N' [Streptacidiphilus jiangxiensis]SEM44627.1 replication restart DNA helicase PriA [Streptacidiphilus jiangxiensis]
MAEPETPETSPVSEQLELIRTELRRAKARPKPKPVADALPVARVVVDKGLSHLDQYFDYAVPARLADAAQPGVRVRVRFGGRVVKGQGRREGGRLVDGYIVERLAASDFAGPLAPLAQVLSPERVLTPELLRLCRAVADRYAGTLADVLQLAVPPKHNKPEAEPVPDAPAEPVPAPQPGGWARYVDGPSFLEALAAGEAPRAVWSALPGPGWPDELARTVAAALASGRGALVVLPDGRAVARVDAALQALLGPDRHVALTAELGAEERYRRWLAVSRGAVRAVVGTRAAMFAPVADLGFVAIWDDGDSSHSEPHAPQPHARDVLLLRAVDAGAAALVGGFAVTVEAAQLLRTGWARPLAGPREELRRAAPLVRTVGDHDQAGDGAAFAARLPSLAWRVARDALAHGPVLVQVPRRGYVPRLACARCREQARCAHCAGPLEAPDATGVLVCTWCGRPEADWHCRECGSFKLRAQVFGARRTADELGRAFPSVPVRTSGRDGVLASVPGAPALVVATPGAEPVAEGGYAAALLLDAWVLLGRPDLRAGEEALRRWLAAGALVRGAAEGGTVVIVAEPSLRPVQALVRWDPAGHAATELAERAELGFPPVSRMAAVSGPPAAVQDLLDLARLPEGTDLLGPVALPTPRGEDRADRVLLRVSPGRGAALATALKAAQAARLARGKAEPVRVRIDPPDIG